MDIKDLIWNSLDDVVVNVVYKLFPYVIIYIRSVSYNQNKMKSEV